MRIALHGQRHSVHTSSIACERPPRECGQVWQVRERGQEGALMASAKCESVGEHVANVALVVEATKYDSITLQQIS
eukprot:362101-Chlamydomonas_euryale.AAC.1